MEKLVEKPPSIKVPAPTEPMMIKRKNYKWSILHFQIFKAMVVNFKTLADEKKRGPEAARFTTIRTLSQIYTQFPKLEIGTIKSTEEYGNTSVSMGLTFVYHFY